MEALIALLNGNVNRMCVTDCKSELKRQRELAIDKINSLYKRNYKRLKEESNE